MAEHQDIPGYEGQVHCGYCHKAIPKSEAYQPEGKDYVAYFCGLDCYRHWFDSQSPKKD